MCSDAELSNLIYCILISRLKLGLDIVMQSDSVPHFVPTCLLVCSFFIPFVFLYGKNFTDFIFVYFIFFVLNI